MLRYLAFASLLLATVLASPAQEAYLLQVPDSGRVQYRFDIDARGNDLSGIAIMKMVNDSIKGVMVNEFGIKAMDFVLSPDRQKVELADVIPFIDKWYIKRIIKADLQYLFNATTAMLGSESDNRTLSTTGDDGSITMTNSKYKISYTFTPIKDEPQPQDDGDPGVEEEAPSDDAAQ